MTEVTGSSAESDSDLTMELDLARVLLRTGRWINDFFVFALFEWISGPASSERTPDSDDSPEASGRCRKSARLDSKVG